MSDNNTTLPAISSASDSGARTRLWPLWLMMALLLMITLALGIALWDQHRRQQVLDQRYQTLDEQVSDLRKTRESLISNRNERIIRLENRLEQQQERTQTQARQIEHNARSLLGLGERTRTDWLLAEAEYLLRLANQRLQLEGDHQGALRLQESADKLLAKVDDAGVYPIRQALAREILTLRTMEPVDVTGLYLELEAAMGMASKLGLQQLFASDSRQQQATGTAAEGASLPGSWQEAWGQVRDTLDRMVRIRRLDEPARVALSPEQNAQSRLHLQLMFEQAAVALLREDQSAYRRALQRAEEWLDRWYDPDDSRVQTLQNLIDEASQYQVSMPTPDISKSLSLLKARVEGRFDETNTESGKKDKDRPDNDTSAEEPAS